MPSSVTLRNLTIFFGNLSAVVLPHSVLQEIQLIPWVWRGFDQLWSEKNVVLSLVLAVWIWQYLFCGVRRLLKKQQPAHNVYVNESGSSYIIWKVLSLSIYAPNTNKNFGLTRKMSVWITKILLRIAVCHIVLIRPQTKLGTSTEISLSLCDMFYWYLSQLQKYMLMF